MHQNDFKINYFFKSLKFWIKRFLIVYVPVFVVSFPSTLPW